MAKKKKNKAAKANESAVSIASIAASLKKDIVQSPREALKTLELDITIAKDPKDKNVSLGQLLESIPETKRSGIATAIVESFIAQEKAQAKFAKEFQKIIPGDLKIVDNGLKKPVPPLTTIIIPGPRIPPRIPVPPVPPKVPVPNPNPKVPVPNPKVPVPNPRIELPRPTIEVPKPRIELPRPTIEVPKPRIEVPKPRIELPRILVREQVVNIKDLKAELIEVERIRKNLPKNATKAEKKAAATAVQQIKSLIKASERSAPKAKKAVSKKSKKK